MLVLSCLEEDKAKKLSSVIPDFVEIQNTSMLTSSLINSIHPDAVITQASLFSIDDLDRINGIIDLERLLLLGSRKDSCKSISEMSHRGILYCQNIDKGRIVKFLLSCSPSNNSSGKEEKENFGIIGTSNCIREIREEIRLFGPMTETVIISGKTGSGKDMTARALHHCSGRTGSFLPINCSAIPDTLIESELFGSVKGAFTGADRDSSGYLRAADRGTLFLDEIGDMPIHMQTKLLRVLEDKRVTPLGSTRSYGVDVRIITATSRNIKKLIKHKKFREDLYYRLNVLSIKVPPLAERKTDIPQLADFFLAKNNSGKKLSTNAMMKLLDHNWPGNIRELKTIIRRAEIISGDLKLIDARHISFI